MFEIMIIMTDFQIIDTSNESIVLFVPFPGPFPYIIRWNGITMLRSEAVPLIQLNISSTHAPLDLSTGVPGTE